MAKETKKSINWLVIVPVAVAIVSLLINLINFLEPRSRQITVNNELGLGVKIYANGEYRGKIKAYSKRNFSFYSNADFPAEIKWEIIQQKDSAGTPIGNPTSGTIKRVDNHSEVNIEHIFDENYFFMPIITNNTEMQCKITVNDGLASEQYAGILLANAKNVNIGYYQWKKNSNLTLDCDDGIHFWGIRNNKIGPKLNVNNPDGATHFTLTD